MFTEQCHNPIMMTKMHNIIASCSECEKMELGLAILLRS